MSSSDAENKIWQWLEKTGYPLQMRLTAQLERDLCGKVFGTFLTSGEVYYDYEAKASREADIVLSFSSTIVMKGPEIEGPVGVEVSFSIECKNTSQPWVAFSTQPYTSVRRSDLTGAMFQHSVRRAVQLGGRAEDAVSRRLESSRDVGWHKRVPQSYLIAEAHRTKNQNDPAWDALRQAVGAASAVISQHAASIGISALYHVVPVIVTTSPLYLAYYSEEQLQLEPVSEVFVRYARAVDETIFVRVVNDSAATTSLTAEMRDVRDAVLALA